MAKKKSVEKQGTPAPPSSNGKGKIILPKGRDIVAELYADNEKHVALIATLENQEDIEFWAIWHDADEYTAKDLGEYLLKEGQMPNWKIGDIKKKHCHICLHFRNPRYAHAVPYELGLGKDDAHLFQKCNDMMKYTHYLWHDPVIWSEKHQYKTEMIFGNVTGMSRAKAYLKKDANYEEDTQYQRIMEYIDSEKRMSIAKMTKWLISNGLIEFYEKHSRILQPYLKEAIDKQRMLDQSRPFEKFNSIDEFMEWKEEKEA